MRNRIALLAVIIMISIAGITLNPRSPTAKALVAAAVPQATPQKPLNREQVGAMLDEDSGRRRIATDSAALAVNKFLTEIYKNISSRHSP